jgi:hypothetical protein
VKQSNSKKSSIGQLNVNSGRKPQVDFWGNDDEDQAAAEDYDDQ